MVLPFGLKETLVIALGACMAAASGSDLPPDAPMAGKNGLTVPQTLEAPPPRYPLVARQDGIGGTVELLVRLDVSGRVQEVGVASCDQPGHGFEEAATEAMLLWRWVPVLRDGKPVEAYTRISVAFEPERAEADRRWAERQQGLREYAEAELFPRAPHVAGRDGVTWPVVRKKRSPVSLYYPRPAKMRDIESRVLLLVEVGEDGKVGEIVLTNAERHGQGFEEAAKSAIERWLFEPATLDEQAVSAWHWVELDFTLRPVDR